MNEIEYELVDAKDQNRFRLPEEEAIKAVLEGRATLFQNQLHNPIELIEAIKRLEKQFSNLGPNCNAPNLLEKAARSLVVDNKLQRMVEGHRLDVFENEKPLSHKIFHLIYFGESGPSNLLDGLRGVDEFNKRNKSGFIRRSGMGLRNIAIKEERLFPAGGDNFLENQSNWYQLSEENWAFHEALFNLENEIQKDLKQAVSFGHILRVMHQNGSDQLLHPEDDFRFKQDQKLSYILSKSLPGNWFPNQELHHKRASARQWMARVFEVADKKNLRPASKDVKEVAAEKFDLTLNAAKDAWQEFAKDRKEKPGRIPDQQKFKLSEIKKIN